MLEFIGGHANIREGVLKKRETAPETLEQQEIAPEALEQRALAILEAIKSLPQPSQETIADENVRALKQTFNAISSALGKYRYELNNYEQYESRWRTAEYASSGVQPRTVGAKPKETTG